MYLQDFGKAALIYKDREISYRDLIDSVSTYLHYYGIKPQERVGIFAENRPDWVYAFYSIWSKRGIPVPIDFMSTAEEVTYILNDSTPEVVFCSDGTKDKLLEAIAQAEHKPRVICFDSTPDPCPQEEELNLEPEDKENTAVIIYTSGTTGSSKGVMLSFNNIFSNVECITSRNIIGKDDRLLAILPLHHILPLQGNIIMPLSSGGQTVFLNQLSSEEILKTMQKYKITELVGVPRVYNLFHSGIISKIKGNKLAAAIFAFSRMLNSYRAGAVIFKKVQDSFGGRIRYFISGGAKLDPSVARDFKALGFKILEGYGMSEASPMIAYSPPKRVKIGSVGPAIDHVEVKAINGELAVKGPNVMQGYYNRPGETADVLKDGWLLTGDIGELDKDGYIFITGRSKEIIILPNGKNLNPEEIENKLMKGSAGIIKEVGVIQKNDQLCAIIYPDFSYIQKENIVNIQETIKWGCIDKYNLSVPPYKKILNFTLVHHELPKTRLGKIKRFTLKEFLNEEVRPKEKTDVPTYREYELLEAYLEKVVKKDVFPDEHMELDLGLDSLDRVELQVQVERTFGVALSDDDLSIHSTVRKLAGYIREKKTKIETEVMQWGKVLKEEIEYDAPRSVILLRLLKFISKPMLRLYFRVEKSGLENIPKAPVIFVPNHQSFMDGLFVADALNGRTLKKTYFFAKDKHLQSRLNKFFARNSNIIALNINRQLKNTIQKLATVLKKGNNMVIFPEGARSRDGSMMEFKKTFAIISKELNIPVVPVAIEGAYDKLAIGKRFPRPGKIRLRFLKPIYPGQMDYDRITFLAQEKIQKFLDEKARIKEA